MVKAFTPYFLLLTFHGLSSGGGKRIRTADHLVANQALSQLSYTPQDCKFEIRISKLYFVVGLGRFELPTSRLSGVRSNHLSYRPFVCSWPTAVTTRSSEDLLPQPSAIFFFSQN